MTQLARWLLLGEWRAHPVRALLAIGAIAVGVALGYAVHLVNAAALNEFTAAVKTLSGQADIQVQGRESWFDEAIYPALASHDGVELASPVLLIDAAMPQRRGSLDIIGLDPLRAGFISPDLIGMPATEQPNAVLADDAIFLSPAAQAWLKRAPGSTLTLRAGSAELQLRVAGGIMRAPAGQRLGVMDIGAAQWRFHHLGQLSRVDLKLREGVDRNRFQHALANELEARHPGRFIVSQPNDADQNSRNNNLSRAYRVNLTVLALVALFTGAFLVFSTQALSVIRRRSQFALLRVLGMERRTLLRQILLEGACLGVLGAGLGIAAGYLLAAAALHFLGGDLGAGFFAGVQPSVHFAPLAAAVFFGLGLGVALLGCLVPALEASAATPAVALKSGNDETALARLARVWPALACLALAAILTRAPPIFELPLMGYAAIGLLLIGGIGLMPRLAAEFFGLINARAMRRARPGPVLALTLARLANAAGQAAIALGGVLASFALMVAMAIMVSSFRVSVDDWLVRLLPADLYTRSASSGDSAALGPREQAALAALPGVARYESLRSTELTLAPDRPPVALVAREVDTHDPGASLTLVGDTLAIPPGAVPVWVSEAMLDLYGVRPGATLSLPLRGSMHTFFVAGVWRDYARQNGAIVMRLPDYRAISGDLDANSAGFWLARGTSAQQLAARIRQLPFGASLDFAQPGDIRAMSMKVFDRSFAVTYLLEAIAIGIGLAGVAATFSAQTLARSREFGMLRHVGVTRGQILAILAIEGSALTALGIACGFVLGWLISLILVFIVNPQSFHWTMHLHLPWTLLANVAGALLVASTLTALASGRQALSSGPIRAVREDW